MGELDGTLRAFQRRACGYYESNADIPRALKDFPHFGIRVSIQMNVTVYEQCFTISGVL
jgi:hypothetical protein